MPLLFNHNRDVVLGKVDNVHFENGRAIANVTFDDDEFSNGIVKKIESGSLRGVSVGYARQHVVTSKKAKNTMANNTTQMSMFATDGNRLKFPL